MLIYPLMPMLTWDFLFSLLKPSRGFVPLNANALVRVERGRSDVQDSSATSTCEHRPDEYTKMTRNH